MWKYQVFKLGTRKKFINYLVFTQEKTGTHKIEHVNWLIPWLIALAIQGTIVSSLRFVSNINFIEMLHTKIINMTIEGKTLTIIFKAIHN